MTIGFKKISLETPTEDFHTAPAPAHQPHQTEDSNDLHDDHANFLPQKAVFSAISTIASLLKRFAVGAVDYAKSFKVDPELIDTVLGSRKADTWTRNDLHNIFYRIPLEERGSFAKQLHVLIEGHDGDPRDLRWISRELRQIPFKEREDFVKQFSELVKGFQGNFAHVCSICSELAEIPFKKERESFVKQLRGLIEGRRGSLESVRWIFNKLAQIPFKEREDLCMLTKGCDGDLFSIFDIFSRLQEVPSEKRGELIKQLHPLMGEYGKKLEDVAQLIQRFKGIPIEKYKAEALKLLAERGTQFDKEDANFRFPEDDSNYPNMSLIQVALHKQNQKAIKSLLEHGALVEPSILDSVFDFQTAVDRQIIGSQQSLKGILLGNHSTPEWALAAVENGAVDQELAEEAVKKNKTELLKRILKHRPARPDMKTTIEIYTDEWDTLRTTAKINAPLTLQTWAKSTKNEAILAAAMKADFNWHTEYQDGNKTTTPVEWMSKHSGQEKIVELLVGGYQAIDPGQLLDTIGNIPKEAKSILEAARANAVKAKSKA